MIMFSERRLLTLILRILLSIIILAFVPEPSLWKDLTFLKSKNSLEKIGTSLRKKSSLIKVEKLFTNNSLKW